MIFSSWSPLGENPHISTCDFQVYSTKGKITLLLEFCINHTGGMPLWGHLDKAAEDDVCGGSQRARWRKLAREQRNLGDKIWKYKKEHKLLHMLNSICICSVCPHNLKLKKKLSSGERISWRILAKVVGASWESVEAAWRRMVCWILSHLRWLRRHGGPRLPPLPRPCRLQGHRQPRGEEEDVGVVPLGEGQLSEDKCSP